MNTQGNNGMWDLLLLPDDESTEQIRRGIGSGSRRRTLTRAESLRAKLGLQRAAVGDESAAAEVRHDIDVATDLLEKVVAQPAIDLTMSDAERTLRAASALEEADRAGISPEEQRALIYMAYAALCLEVTGTKEAPTAKAFVYAPEGSDDGWGNLVAQAVWETIRDESYRGQRAFILHGVEFGSPALFNLLSRLSNEAGQDNNQRRLELAQLALDSVTSSREVLGQHFEGLYSSARLALSQAESQAGLGRAD